MSIFDGNIQSTASSSQIKKTLFNPANGVVYAVGEFNGIASQSTLQIDFKIASSTVIDWQENTDLDVSGLKFNSICKQGTWMIAVGNNAAIRESINGIDWVAPLGVAYTNSWGSLLATAANDFFLLAVGEDGAVAMRNLTSSRGDVYYNWQLLAANNSLTSHTGFLIAGANDAIEPCTFRAVVNRPGTNEFLVAGNNGIMFKYQDLGESYTPVAILVDDAEGRLDPVTKKIKQVNFTTDHILYLGHNGSYYLAVTANSNNGSYKIYKSQTGESTWDAATERWLSSWTLVHETTDKITDLVWQGNISSWAATKSNAAQTRGGLLTSSNGITWVSDAVIESAAATVADTAYQTLTMVGDSAFYLYGATKVTLLGTVAVTPAPEISVSTNILNLPAAAVGSETQRSVTITNIGSADLILTNLIISGAGAENFTVSGCSSSTIAAGSSCELIVKFSPTTASSLPASLFVYHNAASFPKIIDLVGETAVASIGIGPQQLTFEDVNIGSTAQRQVSISNTGTAPLIINSLTITGADSGQFSVAGCELANVQPSATCILLITFAPTSAGTKTASVNISHNASNSPSTIDLAGAGRVSELVFDTTSLILPGTPVGSTYTANITATNTSTEPITINNLQLTGTQSSDYSVSLISSTISAAASQPIQVVFTPSAAGARTAQLAVTHTGTNSPGMVSLIGNGVAGGAVAEYQGAVADYFVITYTFADGRDLDTRTSVVAPANQTGMLGWSRDGQIGNYLTWGGDNTGTGVESVLFNAVEFRQSFPALTSITLNFAAFWYGVVGVLPVSIDITSYVGGQMVKFGYSWNNPTATATNTNFIRYQKQISRYTNDRANNGQQIAQMVLDFADGTVQFIEAPVFSISSNLLEFGNVTANSTATSNLRITNNGSANLTISSAGLSNELDYSILSACTGTIAPEAYCDLSIRFNPTGNIAEQKTSNLTIVHNATTSPTVVSLTGNVVVVTDIIHSQPVSLFSMTSNNQLDFINSANVTSILTTISSNNQLDFINSANVTSIPVTIDSDNTATIGAAQPITLFTISS